MYLVILTFLFSSLEGCAWTPQVETVLEDGPNGFVSLRTISDETFRASHPVHLPESLITQVLKGVSSQGDVRLLQHLLSGSSNPTRIFSTHQIEFLTPLLTAALDQATREELIYFHCPSNSDEPSRALEGNIFAYDTALILTWQYIAYTQQELPKQIRPTARSGDPSGVQTHTAQFSPEQALRSDVLSGIEHLSEIKKNIIAIDYKRLAKLPHPAEDDFSPQSTHHTPDPPIKKNNSPSIHSAQDLPDKKTFKSAVPQGTGEYSEIQALKERMELLKKEMEKQKAELEQLKKENSQALPDIN